MDNVESDLRKNGLYYDEPQTNQIRNDMKNVVNWYALVYTQAQLQPVTNSDNSRQVIQYGYQYDYTHKTAMKQKIDYIPDILIPLKEYAENYIRAKINPAISICFNQCIINRYIPGQGISAHIDSFTYGPYIACFTFLSGRDMEFTDSKTNYILYTKPNTMYIMTGNARYKWRHQMKGRKNDIVENIKILRGECFSVTFRYVHGQ